MSIVSCFYTTVQSRAAADRSFGFLGEHGKRLAPAEQYTVPGNLVDTLAARSQGPEGNRRHFQALERAVTAGDLAIIHTPAVHLFDPTTHLTQVLKINNNVLGHADPCWGAAQASLS